MATAIYEAEKLAQSVVDREAELHNQRIRERYLQLQNAEAMQFAEETRETEYAVRASVLAPEKTVVDTPVFERTPVVTEYTHERVDSPVFTTEKFNAIQVNDTVQIQTPVAPVQAPAIVAEIRTEAQYSLSNLAKAVLVAFTALVVVMMSLICVNTQILNRKAMQYNALQRERAELVERNADIESRIARAQSEDTIREYAESKGMILGDE